MRAGLDLKDFQLSSSDLSSFAAFGGFTGKAVLKNFAKWKRHFQETADLWSWYANRDRQRAPKQNSTIVNECQAVVLAQASAQAAFDNLMALEHGADGQLAGQTRAHLAQAQRVEALARHLDSLVRLLTTLKQSLQGAQSHARGPSKHNNAPRSTKLAYGKDCSWEDAVGELSLHAFGGELNHEQMGLAAEFIQEVTISSRHSIASYA
jgi:hypothetical protein